MSKRIEIDKNRQEEMRRLIVEYFQNERGEELGELSSNLILDFFVKELGPHIYNQGVEDAHVYMKDRVEDLFALQIVKR